ncbi:MAG: DNA-binding protein WhiA [Ruminococcaceae bacterium]|nr:DNA-binding protein WhiA [Oscillospiraceae bacterium]
MEGESFSSSVGNEVCQLRAKSPSRRYFLAGLLCSQALADQKDMPLKIRLHIDNAGKLESFFDEEGYSASFENQTLMLKRKRSDVGTTLLEDMTCACLSGTIPEEAADDDGTHRFERYFMRGIFLGCGYISDPVKTYRAEFHVSNGACAILTVQALHSLGINASLTSRDNYAQIYFKAGDSVSDFLGYIGAVKAVLEFENIRAAKELNRQVSRTFNCDVGNSRRQSEAGASRNELIEKLMKSPLASNLTPELKEAAKANLENPGASIAELGAMMDPPISKSGMSHRLSKLLELAEGL